MFMISQRIGRRLRTHVADVVNMVRGLEFPESCDVKGANAETIAFFKTTRSQVVAEVGIYAGDTTMLLAQHMGVNGTLHLFDFEERVAAVTQQVRGACTVIGHGNSHKTHDSYTWSLMRVLEEHPAPIFDYVFLDGSHTYEIDIAAFCLIDRLLKVGGHLDFDDYSWSIARSTTMNPRVFPQVRKMFTPEQIEARHIKMLVDLLVKRDPRYTEVVKDKIYRRVAL